MSLKNMVQASYASGWTVSPLDRAVATDGGRIWCSRFSRLLLADANSTEDRRIHSLNYLTYDIVFVMLFMLNCSHELGEFLTGWPYQFFLPPFLQAD